MTTPHPQAHILKAIAEDKDAKIEIMCSTNCPPTWFPASMHYVFELPNGTYRIAPKPDPDGWIEWHGGENPAPGQSVQIRLRDRWAEDIDIVRKADVLDWKYRQYPSDIIAYRVVKEPAKKRVGHLYAYLGLAGWITVFLEERSILPPGAIKISGTRTEIPE